MGMTGEEVIREQKGKKVEGTGTEGAGGGVRRGGSVLRWGRKKKVEGATQKMGGNALQTVRRTKRGRGRRSPASSSNTFLPVQRHYNL